MSPSRRYELREPELDAAIDALVASASKRFGGLESDDLVRQMLVSVIALAREDAEIGDLKLLNSTLKELRHALRVFEPYRDRRKVAAFGSARTPRTSPEWEQARRFCARLAEEGWMTITGGGGGIMEAAQTGAGRDASFAANIQLPFEQHPNAVIDGDPKLINFRYFFSRKLTFVKESHAIALFPGGFGTLDEGFEALTLIQTGKSELLPVVCVDAPGGSYWSELNEYVERQMLDKGMISERDRSLYFVTDDAELAVREVLTFYRNYHSSRHVGDKLVIRLCHAPTTEQLDLLNQEFADVLTRGSIVASEPLRQEAHEAVGLPRLILQVDRRAVARLRELVDRLNGFAESADLHPAASSREIVEMPLSPDAQRRRDEL